MLKDNLQHSLCFNYVLMKFAISLIFMVCILQEPSSPNYKAIYNLTYSPDSNQIQNKKSENFFLFVKEGTRSFCTSENFLKKDSISVLVKNGVLSEYDIIGNSNNRFKTVFSQFVQKQYSDKTIKVYETIGLYPYTYSVQSDLKWEIGAERDTLVDYPCVKATTNYAGREYEAWFTPEIPISDGPYIFSGLPGLIIKVSDTRNHYVFTLVQFGEYNDKITEVPVRRLPNRSQAVNLTSASQPIALKEVKVKPPLITQDGDTISYSVAAFKSQSDRVIADVIRKLPGIEVEADGRILYQGKPINKYYIEGMDLLSNKYRLANDNLPADAVSRVQVIENHQPIRMLDSLVFSDRAALNIKLKNEVTVTGTAHLGAGGTPFLWEANLTPMLFSRKNQMIASLQSNNTGNNVSAQLKDMAPGTVFNPLQNDSKKKDGLALQPLAIPPFESTQWLDNRVLLGTANYLKRLRNDFELRGNVAYNNDSSSSEEIPSQNT